MNHQRNNLNKMVKLGRMDKEDCGKFMGEIEYKMYDELNTPPKFKLPISTDLIKEINWLKELSDNAVKTLDQLVEVKIFPFNYQFREELMPKNGLGIIARGIAKLTKDGMDIDSEVLGNGDILSHVNPKVSKIDKVVCETPLTVIWVSASKIDTLKVGCPIEKKLSI